MPRSKGKGSKVKHKPGFIAPTKAAKSKARPK
jgi:hypothetical protein